MATAFFFLSSLASERDLLGSLHDHLTEMTSWKPKGHKWRTKISPCFFCLFFFFFFLPSHILFVFLRALGIVEWWKACRQIPTSKTFQLCGPVLNFSFLFYETRIWVSVRHEMSRIQYLANGSPLINGYQYYWSDFMGIPFIFWSSVHFCFPLFFSFLFC